MAAQGDPERTVDGIGTAGPARERFPVSLMHAAATLYYLRDETQAEVARSLGVSRATVSRLLAEARSQGIVRIEVVDPPDHSSDDLTRRLQEALGLRSVVLCPSTHPSVLGARLAEGLGRALEAAAPGEGDVVLVSSGRTTWETSQHVLPRMPGSLVAPTVGGQSEPEAWYQTNEITRMFAEQVGGRPVFLYAPAQPSAELYDRLIEDPGTRRVLDLWQRATCAVLGVGAPPLTRDSLPGYVPRDAAWLGRAAGDICTRFFDADGATVDFPGSERLIATSYDTLRRIPHTIAVAAGSRKVPSLLAGARAGWFNTLVTDVDTAGALLAGTQALAEPS